MGWVPLEEEAVGLHLLSRPVRTQGEDSCLQTSRAPVPHTLALLRTLIFNFPASRTGRNESWSRSLWYSVITALDKGFPSPLRYLPRWWAFNSYPWHSTVNELPRAGQKGAHRAQKLSTAPDLKFCLQHIFPQKHAPDHTYTFSIL